MSDTNKGLNKGPSDASAPPPPPPPPPAVSTKNWAAGQRDSLQCLHQECGASSVSLTSPRLPLSSSLPRRGWGSTGRDLVSAYPERQSDEGDCGPGPASHATKQVMLLPKGKKSPSEGSSSASRSHGNEQQLWSLWHCVHVSQATSTREAVPALLPAETTEASTTLLAFPDRTEAQEAKYLADGTHSWCEPIGQCNSKAWLFPVLFQKSKPSETPHLTNFAKGCRDSAPFQGFNTSCFGLSCSLTALNFWEL